ncbi:MAG: hypothetical protein ACFWT0_01425 [Bifidobacterium crudilactis]|jgi:hypothetical protein
MVSASLPVTVVRPENISPMVSANRTVTVARPASISRTVSANHMVSASLTASISRQVATVVMTVVAHLLPTRAKARVSIRMGLTDVRVATGRNPTVRALTVPRRGRAVAETSTSVTVRIAESMIHAVIPRQPVADSVHVVTVRGAAANTAHMAVATVMDNEAKAGAETDTVHVEISTIATVSVVSIRIGTMNIVPRDGTMTIGAGGTAEIRAATHEVRIVAAESSAVHTVVMAASTATIVVVATIVVATTAVATIAIIIAATAHGMMVGRIMVSTVVMTTAADTVNVIITMTAATVAGISVVMNAARSMAATTRSALTSHVATPMAPYPSHRRTRIRTAVPESRKCRKAWNGRCSPRTRRNVFAV